MTDGFQGYNKVKNVNRCICLDKWIAQADNSRFFKEKDNRTPEQQELIKLRKQNQQPKMENDILKQAALILGRK